MASSSGVSTKRRTGAPGTTVAFPLLTKTGNQNGVNGTRDEVYKANLRARIDREFDFEDNIATHVQTVSFPSIATTGTTSVMLVVERSGYLLAADFSSVSALAAHDTNYLTFSIANALGSGSGSTAMLAATDANTTKATGGTALTAKALRSLTLNGTAANLRVAKGDTLLVSAAASGTLAGAVDGGTVALQIATIPMALSPRITRTAGSPLVAPVSNEDGGAIICQLSATNEANVAGFDLADQKPIEASKQPWYEARVKISGAAANTRFVWGVGSDYNATFDSFTLNAWFRVEGNDLSLLCETDDDTTNTDDQDTGIDLVADTYVNLGIDLALPGAVDFYVNGQKVKTLAASALTGNLQPVQYVQKASGTGEQSFTCERLRWSANRI